MKNSLYDRLWRRELGEPSHRASIRGIYGSKEWVDDLDIVNELGGHTGCVNALWYVCGPLTIGGVTVFFPFSLVGFMRLLRV